MGIILCATRGGEASYYTQDKAIALAKERGDTLAFLYVVDLRFLDKIAAPIVVNVEKELAQMGKFLLLMARERAEEKGVEAETIVRKGKLREELKNAAREQNASLVVLGRPAGKESVFRISALKAFAEEIETETGVETRIV